MAQMTAAEISRLLDEQSRSLRLYAAQWTESPDDVAQEAFIALAALADRPDDPVSWLYAVVRNKAQMAARGDRRRQGREQGVANDQAGWFEPSYDDPIDASVAEAALRELDEETREIIVAHVWGNLTFRQIAEVMGSSSSTVHRRFADGLKTLRDKLGVTWIPSNTTTRK